MESLLLTVSFFIHMILLFGIYYLYKEIQTLKNENADANDIAELFESYLLEIKVENERLENESFSQPTKIKKDTISNSPKNEELLKENESIMVDTDLNDYAPVSPVARDELETTLQAKILQLSSQGYSSDNIAEKLDCGKTEVALILKFHKNRKS